MLLCPWPLGNIFAFPQMDGRSLKAQRYENVEALNGLFSLSHKAYFPGKS